MCPYTSIKDEDGEDMDGGGGVFIVSILYINVVVRTLKIIVIPW